jgi:putative transposase
MEVTLAQQAPKVELTVKQRAIIERLARSRTEPQRLVERAQVVLRSANGELCVDQAQALGIDAQRSRRWRKRFARSYEVLASAEAADDPSDLEKKIREVLSDNYRSGTPPKFSPEQVTTIIALACHEPSELDLPISHWTPDDLARQAVKLGIVKSISGRHVDRFLKRSRPSSAPQPLLAESEHRELRGVRRGDSEDQRALQDLARTQGRGRSRRQLR